MTKKKVIILVAVSVVSIVAFLTYRYFVYGKGNKGLINPTTFGY